MAAGVPFTQDFTITVSPAFGLIAVTGITNVPNTATVGTPLNLTGTVNPPNATHQTISWSIQDTSTTGATITGSTLNALSPGTVTIRATVANGLATGVPFTQDFTIMVSPAFVVTPPSHGQGYRSDRDPSPANAGLSATTATFDKADPQDITITLNRNGHAFRELRRSPLLARGTDYTVDSSDRFTISATYLSALDVGRHTFTFVMSGGTNPALVVTVVDSTPEAETAPTPDAIPRPAIQPTPLPFTDVEPWAWYYPHVRTVWEYQLFLGTVPNLFSPDMPMTRAMFAQVLANMEGVELSLYSASRFDDVTVGAWYAPAVEWAASVGIISGYGDNTFGPRDNISREQMAAMLANYIRFKGYSIPSAQAAAFNDEENISPWAREAVRMMQGSRIISGYPDGSFGPQATATRAEVATIFAKFIEAADMPRRE